MLHILERFFPKPHVEPRWHAATKVENLAAQQKRTDVILELAVYRATTTPSQRKAEADAWFARAAAKARTTQRLMRVVGRVG